MRVDPESKKKQWGTDEDPTVEPEVEETPDHAW